MARDEYFLRSNSPGPLKLAMMDITSSTNTRTMVAALVGNLPCGNKAPTLSTQDLDATRAVDFGALVTSLAFDWTVRQRVSGTTLNWHIVESLSLPKLAAFPLGLGQALFPVALSAVQFASEWVRFGLPPRIHGCTEQERIRIETVIDAALGAVMGLGNEDLRHVFSDCDHARPVNSHTESTPAKGLWRVDKDRDPELRRTVLSLVASCDLQSKIQACDGDCLQGINAFLSEPHGEGWMLPETLRLADYDLGHDRRASLAQPVASILGPRFFDYQLVQSRDESEQECRLHARNLLGTTAYAELVRNVQRDDAVHAPVPGSSDSTSNQPKVTNLQAATPAPTVAEHQAKKDATLRWRGDQPDLFE